MFVPLAVNVKEVFTYWYIQTGLDWGKGETKLPPPKVKQYTALDVTVGRFIFISKNPEAGIVNVGVVVYTNKSPELVSYVSKLNIDPLLLANVNVAVGVPNTLITL